MARSYPEAMHTRFQAIRNEVNLLEIWTLAKEMPRYARHDKKKRGRPKHRGQLGVRKSTTHIVIPSEARDLLS